MKQGITILLCVIGLLANAQTANNNSLYYPSVPGMQVGFSMSVYPGSHPTGYDIDQSLGLIPNPEASTNVIFELDFFVNDQGQLFRRTFPNNQNLTLTVQFEIETHSISTCLHYYKKVWVRGNGSFPSTYGKINILSINGDKTICELKVDVSGTRPGITAGVVLPGTSAPVNPNNELELFVTGPGATIDNGINSLPVIVNGTTASASGIGPDQLIGCVYSVGSGRFNPEHKTNNAVNNTIRIYPNPIASQETIQLEANDNLLGTIELRNLQGKLLKSQFCNCYKTEFSLKNLQPGMYVITTSYADVQTANKIVVQ